MTEFWKGFVCGKVTTYIAIAIVLVLTGGPR